jgi:hypothetical protein
VDSTNDIVREGLNERGDVPTDLFHEVCSISITWFEGWLDAKETGTHKAMDRSKDEPGKKADSGTGR